MEYNMLTIYDIKYYPLIYEYYKKCALNIKYISQDNSISLKKSLIWHILTIELLSA